MINEKYKSYTKSNTFVIPNLETIDDYNTTSPHLSQTEDECLSLITKIESQNTLINQFEFWINNLLKLVKFTKNGEYLDKIITGLDKIESLQTEKEILRSILSDEYRDNLDLMKKIHELKSQIEYLKDKVLCKDENESILQKHILIDSINSLSQELDFIGYKNSKYKEATGSTDQINLDKELQNLKAENTVLRTRIKDKVTFPSKFGLNKNYNQSGSTSESYFSCCSLNSRNEESITMELNYFKK